MARICATFECLQIRKNRKKCHNQSNLMVRENFKSAQLARTLFNIKLKHTNTLNSRRLHWELFACKFAFNLFPSSRFKRWLFSFCCCCCFCLFSVRFVCLIESIESRWSRTNGARIERRTRSINSNNKLLWLHAFMLDYKSHTHTHTHKHMQTIFNLLFTPLAHYNVEKTTHGIAERVNWWNKRQNRRIIVKRKSEFQWENCGAATVWLHLYDLCVTTAYIQCTIIEWIKCCVYYSRFFI